ncbi:peroxisomal biogenesis factor 10 [Arctopsyche grandis]|uniref:peroxisomal biogenesis factor 10 n=1 Tax=Arctopsyche grandis TaxID=121162 RepID=UPI00406D78A9
MALAIASTAAIFRAAQKDEFFTGMLASRCNDVLRLLGNRTWNKYSQHTAKASQLLYSSLTTLKDFQTLGEEYTGIVQVDDTYMKIPLKLYQIISILLGAFGETIVQKTLKNLKGKVSQNDNMLPDAKRACMKLLLIIQWAIPIVKELHRAWFYLGGQHYNIEKRLMAINYVSSVPGASPPSGLLRPLGIPTLFRAILNAVNSPPTFDEIDTKDVKASVSDVAACSGCLEPNVTPCALPCGHILCNQCARSSNVCFLCRAPYFPRRTVPLQNFSLKL